MARLILRYLRLLDRLPRHRRAAVLIGSIGVWGAVGFGAGAAVDALIDNPQTKAVTLLLFLVALAVLVAGTVVRFRPMPYPRRYRWTEVQFDPATGPAPCALCGFDCIPGGFWTPVPGFLNHVMHTMGCGPTIPGEPRLAAPTLYRLPDGGYRLLD